MAEFRYKAYISYSHKDEVLATWLHRALESYRVPRGLVGRQTTLGQVPDRIRPVFRDRDDLSSATDLKDTVKQALADSENLIVVCSPNAVASHWVNEEILQFASLGRADRVFCIIVGGDLAADGSVSDCFPAALAEIGLQEPLAADVRDWADGKNIAKIKLTAGLLGVRLDELLQRDLKRRRKRQLLVALGITAALVLAVITIFAQISERQERERTEQLATFIVDLGERLQSDVDLETRALIGEQATTYFQSLNLDKLSPETGIKVAVAIRQLGLVSEGLGRPDEALESFQQSRDLLLTLVEKYPGMPGILFQLAYAEFYIGNLQLEQGRFDEARQAMQNNYLLNQKLVEIDADNPDWILELAYAHNNLAALQMDSGKGISREVLEHVAEAARLMERVQVLRPDDEAVADGYAAILAWAADAQFHACNLEEAALLRGRNRELAKSVSQADPGNNYMKLQYAYANTGVARLQISTGRFDLAERNLKVAISTLQQLSNADPSNITYRNEALFRQVMLAALLGESGQLETAQRMLTRLRLEFALTGDFASENGNVQNEYLKFLLTDANVEYQLGNLDQAKEILRFALQQLETKLNSGGGDVFESELRVKARYQWWELSGVDNSELLDAIPGPVLNSSNEFRSCIEAESAARIYIMKGDKDSAAREVAYLTSKGYAAPDYKRFCTSQGLCEQ